jgi:hypothetical protein
MAENWARSPAASHARAMLLVAIGVVLALFASDLRDFVNRSRTRG